MLQMQAFETYAGTGWDFVNTWKMLGGDYPRLAWQSISQGSLTITIEPTEAVAAGAMWRRANSITWHNSGYTEYCIPNNYSIEFKDALGWSTPEAIQAIINENQGTEINVIYKEPLGSENNPYLITSLNDFDEFAAGSSYWVENFHTKLMCDIDLTGRTYSTAVIASDTDNSNEAVFDGTSFNGVFDGNGYKISNLTINPGTAKNDFLGLFGQMGSTASIENLTIESVSMTSADIGANATYFIGSLCGRSLGTISRCVADGSIIVHYSGYIGGLIGQNEQGQAFYCQTNVNVTAGDYSGYIGGLVGVNLEGILENTRALGDVTGGNNSNTIGGLAGCNQGTGASITNSYAGGDVASGNDSDSTGGLCGYNKDSLIFNCYAQGNVTGRSSSNGLGGICGYNWDAGIANCYSTGSVQTGSYIGSLCGYHIGSAAIIADSFWDTETSGLSIGYNLSSSDPGAVSNVLGKTTDQMKTKSTFTSAGWDFIDESANGTDDIWRLCINGTDYPKFFWDVIPGDFTCPDGVNLGDYAVLAFAWLSESGDTNWNSRCDISNPNDSVIDTADLAVFCENWLSGIETPVVPPIDNMIAYWQMDEGSGSIVSDSSGNEHTGTVYEASWTSGISSNALSFDGINDYVAISYDSDFAYTIGQDDLTLSAWVYPHSKDSSESGAIYSDRAVGNDVVAVSMKVSSGMFNVGGWSPTSDSYTVQASVPANNKWYLMTAVFDSSEVKLYIDGTLKSSASLSGVSLTNGGTGMMLGKHQGGSWSNYFDGIIDDVRIYNKALSSSEVAALCNPAELTVIYSENLDSNPGWIAEGQWEFGIPLGLGGTYGNPDPASGYTGSNVYGVNLAGNYSTSASQVGPYYLTAGPFDCGGYSGITLSFYRWLNLDEPMYTPASVEVSINGQDWYPVWQYNASIPTDKITDSTWVPIEYDISQYADNQSTVYIRWGYTVYGSSGAYPESGWNIDDIQLLGEI
jgi:hypothetical protein